MAKNGELPGRATLLDVVKGVQVKESYNLPQSPELQRLKSEASRLRSELLRNKRLRELESKAAKLERNEKAKHEAKRKRKWSLLTKVKLAPITPALIAEVRKFAGV